MTGKLLNLIGGALLFTPMVMGGAQAQQTPLVRDPADTRIQGQVQPVTPMGAPGTQPIDRFGRVGGTIGGSDRWADSGGETSPAPSPIRPPFVQGTGRRPDPSYQGTLWSEPGRGGGVGYGEGR